jgi:uncharacterized protein (DUF58 family)
MTPTWRNPALRALRGIELLVRRRVEGPLHGDHRSLLRGLGSEPGDARVYEPGDDVRRMDWTVTARTAVPHVRDAVADRDLDVSVLLDRSGSMTFGTIGRTKRDLALEALTAIGWLAVRGSGRLGVLDLTGGLDRWWHVRASRDRLTALLGELARVPASDEPADLAGALTRLNALARRRGLVVVISDLIGPGTWVRPLRVLASRHDVLAVEIVDPRELALPDVGPLVVRDAETGQRRYVDTARPDIRARYSEAASRRRAIVAASLRQAGVGHIALRTDGDPIAELGRYLLARRRAAGAPLRRRETAA